MCVVCDPRNATFSLTQNKSSFLSDRRLGEQQGTALIEKGVATLQQTLWEFLMKYLLPKLGVN